MSKMLGQLDDYIQPKKKKAGLQKGLISRRQSYPTGSGGKPALGFDDFLGRKVKTCPGDGSFQ